MSLDFNHLHSSGLPISLDAEIPRKRQSTHSRACLENSSSDAATEPKRRRRSASSAAENAGSIDTNFAMETDREAQSYYVCIENLPVPINLKELKVYLERRLIGHRLVAKAQRVWEFMLSEKFHNCTLIRLSDRLEAETIVQKVHNCSFKGGLLLHVRLWTPDEAMTFQTSSIYKMNITIAPPSQRVTSDTAYEPSSVYSHRERSLEKDSTPYAAYIGNLPRTFDRMDLANFIVQRTKDHGMPTAAAQELYDNMQVVGPCTAFLEFPSLEVARRVVMRTKNNRFRRGGCLDVRLLVPPSAPEFGQQVQESMKVLQNSNEEKEKFILALKKENKELEAMLLAKPGERENGEVINTPELTLAAVNTSSETNDKQEKTQITSTGDSQELKEKIQRLEIQLEESHDRFMELTRSLTQQSLMFSEERQLSSKLQQRLNEEIVRREAAEARLMTVQQQQLAPPPTTTRRSLTLSEESQVKAEETGCDI